MPEAAPPQAPAPPPAKKSGTLKTILIALIAVAVGGGGAAFWFSRQQPVAAAEAKPVAHGLLTFDPFVVNLADGTGSHFLRVTLQLVVDTADEADRIQKTPVQLSQARSAVLECLAQQTAAQLITPEGKAALKQALSTRVSGLLKPVKVSDVLFSEFVVQF